ncbi:hypothetical protein C8J57DRAFT_1376604 [Mycena rebaudengoi]|nr:hypothetical protein C8J57DRAFT_1376604 [Mycena rebaudengoi]
MDYYASDPRTPLEKSLLRLMSNSAFHHLHVRNSEATSSFLMSAMAVCPTLTVISSNVNDGWRPKSCVTSPLTIRSVPPFVALRSLDLPNAYGILNDCLLHPDIVPYLRSLTQLRLDVIPREFLTKFLAITSPTLERLTVRVRYRHRGFFWWDWAFELC